MPAPGKKAGCAGAGSEAESEEWSPAHVNVRGRTVNTRTCWKMSIGAAVLVIGGTAMPVESKILPHLRQIGGRRFP